MNLRRVRVVLVIATCVGNRTVRAQDATPAHEVQLVDRGPRFLSAPTDGSAPVDVSTAPVFLRRVTVEFERVPLGQALEAVGRQAQVRFSYSRAEVPVDLPVSVSATNITLAGALHEILVGTALDVRLLAKGMLSVVPKPGVTVAAGRKQQGGGTIGGRVTDAVTRTPLDQVAVRVEGLSLGAVTTGDGRYAIHNISPGTYHLVARRVGYTPLIKTVTVADSIAAVDFALTAAATKLNEVVTTAVGNQRRYEVGNVISTINADSIAPTAPITSLTDLISARAPGVQVEETSGLTGAGETIRIRGRSSLVLQNDPILIVDGVRQDNAAASDVDAQPGMFNGNGTAHPAPTRLNDLDFSDIESIDVLKGPSAATEYGTDAANGVIVVRTKHGHAGHPEWHVAAEQTASGIPERFSNNYYSWGHTTDGTNTAVACPLVPSPFASTYGSTAGTCTVDSVTQWNPLNHPAYSIFGTGSRGKYNVSVGGGSDAVRYFVSGGLSNETGLTQIPSVFRRLADSLALGLPNSASRPNVEAQRSARVNTAMRLGPMVDLSATGSYLSTYQTTPDASFLLLGLYFGPALRDAAHGFGYGSYAPIGELSATGSEQTNRAIGGLTGTWRPVTWLTGHATVGIDHGSHRSQLLNYPLANPAYQSQAPFLGLVTAITDVYSADARGAATAAISAQIRSVTSLGVQLADTRTNGTDASSHSISATNLTLNGAPGPLVAQIANRQATLGGYAEELVSLADRLFLTGALRIDGGSGFGRNYATATYPKASMSWLAITTGPTTLRLRTAYGESGVQPLNGAAFQLYQPSVAYTLSGTSSVYQLSWPGNPSLRPERTAELEGGADLGLWGNRVSIELTGYAKTTRDALVNVATSDLGGYAFQENIGKVRNTGVEGSAAVSIVTGHPVTWDVTLSSSINHNRLISLAPGVPAQTTIGNGAQFRQARGYPLYGIWGLPVTYADANHDGIIELSEVAVVDSAVFVGQSQPTQELSVGTRVGLWGGVVAVSGLVDYRGGYRIPNTGAYDQALIAASGRAQNDPHAPLWEQARSVAVAVAPCCTEPRGFVEDGSFTRVRELGITYTLPRTITHGLRVQNVSVTGAARNLVLWTHYTGSDPETFNGAAYNVQFAPTSGGFVVNNDVREDNAAVPLARYWVVRLNVGL